MVEKTKEIKKAGSTDVIVNDRIVTIEEVKKFLCPLATEKELYMAMNIIKSYNLNPFKREVHLIKYSADSPISIVVGYEVYLKRAERTGKLNGWKVEITEDGLYAKLTIHRKDWKDPFEWEVKLSEFSKNQATWKQIPEFMAKKVVIAQGFRLAFPDEIGGMPYTKEEREVFEIESEPEKQSGKGAVEMPRAVGEQPDPVADPYKAMLEQFAAAKSTAGPDVYYYALKKNGKKHANEIKTIEEGNKILKEIQDALDA